MTRCGEVEPGKWAVPSALACVRQTYRSNLCDFDPPSLIHTFCDHGSHYGWNAFAHVLPVRGLVFVRLWTFVGHLLPIFEFLKTLYQFVPTYILICFCASVRSSRMSRSLRAVRRKGMSRFRKLLTCLLSEKYKRPSTHFVLFYIHNLSYFSHLVL